MTIGFGLTLIKTEKNSQLFGFKSQKSPIKFGNWVKCLIFRLIIHVDRILCFASIVLVNIVSGRLKETHVFCEKFWDTLYNL